MEKINKALFIVPFAIVAIYIGYVQLFANDMFFYGLLIIGFGWMFITIKESIQIKKTVFSIGWILCALIMIFSISYTYSVNSGIKYTLVFSSFIVIAIGLSGMNDWVFIYQKCLIFSLSVHVLFTIFNIFFPKVALSISKQLLTPDVYNLTVRWIDDSFHFSGLSGQTVINAFFFTILLGLAFCNLITKNISKWGWILIPVLGILLILTGKKGSIVANLVAVLVICYIYKYAKGHSIRKIYIFCLLGVVAMCMLAIVITPEQIKNIMGTSVISRSRIYTQVWDMFWKSPIIGNGVDSTSFYVGHSAHNSFVQILCEYGIIGLVIFVTTIVMTFISVFKIGVHLIKNNLVEKKQQSVIIFGIYYQVYFLVNGLFESAFFNYRMLLIYLFSVAACYSVLKKQQSNNEKIYMA